MRLRVTAAAVLLLCAAPVPADAAVPVLVIDGKGFGHGVGMAQDGAYWMGKGGSTTPQILSQFYPGTKLGKAGGTVRVAVAAAGADGLTVAFPNGGEVRDAQSGAQSSGFPVRVGAGAQVRLRFDGSRYSVEGGSSTSAAAATGPQPVVFAAPDQLPTTTTVPSSTTSTSTTSTSTTSTTAPAPATTTTAAPPPKPTGPSSARPLWAVSSGTVSVPARGRRYRGVLEATAVRGPFRLVNQVDVEAYLRGMGEVRNPSWPAAGLRAQAVAARTYALRAMRASGELCDDQRCQVYLGAQAEYAAMDKAVKDTGGQVVLFGTSLASTVYSANGGAHSASRQEGFGLPDDGTYPYLRAAPYPTQDPSPWTVQVALADVAARLAYKGTLARVSVAQAGPSGRAVSVTLTGSAGDKAVTGMAFARAFSLKSTLFSLRGDTADAAPAPPPEGGSLQSLPEDAGPHYDPNGLPPDPLTPDELVRAVPPLDAFPAGPPDDLAGLADAGPLTARSHPWPWASLAGFCLLVVAAAAGGLHFARKG
ncbi:MAG TPA: SpoIID/LytB domain-containing protein [Acidimicrobiales bacterium]|jgi:stage II sporulation protein D|nr:SpoIID/LytB domain-containing protein [Acidimicrobiales bacterium]